MVSCGERDTHSSPHTHTHTERERESIMCLLLKTDEGGLYISSLSLTWKPSFQFHFGSSLRVSLGSSWSSGSLAKCREERKREEVTAWGAAGGGWPKASATLRSAWHGEERRVAGKGERK